MFKFDMENQTDRQGVAAILKLSFHSDFQAYSKMLQAKLDALRLEGDTKTGLDRDWNQGHRQALQFLLDLPNLAREIHARNQHR